MSSDKKHLIIAQTHTDKRSLLPACTIPAGAWWEELHRDTGAASQREPNILNHSQRPRQRFFEVDSGDRQIFTQPQGNKRSLQRKNEQKSKSSLS